MDEIIEYGIINAVEEHVIVWDAGARDVLETIFNRLYKERERKAFEAGFKAGVLEKRARGRVMVGHMDENYHEWKYNEISAK